MSSADRKGRDSLAGTADGAVRADLESVFRQHYALVVGVAARVLGSRDAAEDVAQDVFVSFSRSAVPADEARGWLSVAAVHTALNRIRSERRRSQREERVSSLSEPQPPDTADAVVALGDRERVRAGLAQLPPKQAAAVVLRHSGLTYAEVAEALDIPASSVGTTVRRAERALRKELEGHATSD